MALPDVKQRALVMFGPLWKNQATDPKEIQSRRLLAVSCFAKWGAHTSSMWFVVVLCRDMWGFSDGKSSMAT